MVHRNVPIALPSTGDEEWEALREPLQSGWLTQGPVVRRFEEAFARRHDVPHALATTSCTTALHLALAALGIGPGDEVIVPAFTWIATANAVVYCGATPVFVDVDLDTFNMDPALTAAAVTPATRAVVPVHLFGLCADMTAIGTAVGPSIAVVEDAACAAGASYHGRPAGGLGSAACFSFHPRKSITTGEGGMLVTADADLAGRAEQLRNHGAAVPEEVRHHGPAPFLLPDFDELGFNYRMTDLQAAIGLVQLSKLDAFVDERAQWAKWYSDELASLGWLRLPEEPEGGRHAWQAYVTVVDEDAPIARNDLMARLHELGVATRPGTHSVPSTGYYRRRLDVETDSYPVATRLQEQSMAIPLHNRMTHDDYEHVVSAIRATVGAR
jgi:dTDP-4-amino-4,6-dideoxygalactose transaminase